MNALSNRSDAVEDARTKMIAQQIRTWDVLSQDVLDLLHVVRREQFVPPVYRALAFVDTEIPLVVEVNGSNEETGESMLPPKFEARILQEIAVQPTESVVEIGAGSGYMAALLAAFAARVTTVEIDPRLAAFAAANLARAGRDDVRVECGNGAAGWKPADEVDVLVVSGSLPYLPDALKRQVRIGGRIAAVVGDAPAMTAVLLHRTGGETWDTVPLFDTVVKPLREGPRVSRFEF